MPRFPECTPCPIPASGQIFTRLTAEEDTQTIDFTRNLRAAFQQAAPRRRNATGRRGDGVVRVFEDGSGDGVGLNNGTTRATGKEQSLNGLGRRGKMSAAPVRAAPRAPVSRVVHQEKVEAADKENKEPLKKEPRRRTIYVPSEDTTILTIHPGIKYTGDDQTTDCFQLLPNIGTQLGEARARTQSGRTKARQSLAVAPKRGPLQPTLSRLQENAVSNFNLPGRPTGKENVPPGAVCVTGKGKGPGEHAIFTAKAKSLREAPCVNGSRQRRMSPVAVSKRPVSAPLRNSASPKGDPDCGQDRKRDEKASILSETASNALQSRKSPNQVPQKLVKPAIKLSNATHVQYPLLQEDISQPQMFEDTWLSNQETAITELINSLFAIATPAALVNPKPTLKALRHELMHLYQSGPMLLLFKRLQASLLYGALSSPKDTAPEAIRLMNDLGVRRRFLHLWMKTYNLDVLRVAAEVVVGREISRGSASPAGRRTSGSNDVEAFIETCLLHNEDAVHPIESQANSTLWSWRRTMQRSLMLINLLDKAKEMDIIPTRLFRKMSTHKSSTAVLQDLIALLVPWGGNLSRALGHLDYLTVHVQYPLSEYDYTIQNLAVDLRDGVRLTHLVELLLYPPLQLVMMHNDTTVMMPSGEILTSSADGHSSGVLSQHLKFPCLGRVPKLYNVQIALSALRGVQGVAGIAESIRAEDIVDGHREKTLIMLWGLVGSWGLDCLVDKTDLKEEVRRLRKCSGVNNIDDEEGLLTPVSDSQKQLLLAWAKGVASKHGMSVWNLTTSFADGRVFECLVNEYQRYLGPQGGYAADMPLETKLRKLGCSTSFASIFGRTTQAEQLFDQDFTIAALAYFSSRLLGASQKRRKMAWLAHDCMMVVVTRNRVITAATTIQRAWRAYGSRKAEWLEDAEPSDIWLV
ncbi:hypothetical protein MMC30_009102 [Trapelia coarctata]|nr:hypothetical protein [Trapelia coarctata]